MKNKFENMEARIKQLEDALKEIIMVCNEGVIISNSDNMNKVLSSPTLIKLPSSFVIKIAEKALR